jgi:hypothetical protein
MWAKNKTMVHLRQRSEYFSKVYYSKAPRSCGAQEDVFGTSIFPLGAFCIPALVVGIGEGGDKTMRDSLWARDFTSRWGGMGKSFGTATKRIWGNPFVSRKSPLMRRKNASCGCPSHTHQIGQNQLVSLFIQRKTPGGIRGIQDAILQ